MFFGGGFVPALSLVGGRYNLDYPDEKWGLADSHHGTGEDMREGPF